MNATSSAQKLKFSQSITFALVIFAVIPALAVGIFLVDKFSSNVTLQTQRELELVAKGAGTQIEHQVSTAFAQAEYLAGDSDVFLATRSLLFINDATKRLKDLANSNSIITQVALLNNNQDAIIGIPEIPQLPAPAKNTFPDALELLTSSQNMRFVSKAFAAPKRIYLRIPLQSTAGVPGNAALIISFSYANMLETAQALVPAAMGITLKQNDTILAQVFPAVLGPTLSHAADLSIFRQNTQLASNPLPLHFSLEVTDSLKQRMKPVDETRIRFLLMVLILSAQAAGIALMVSRSFLKPLRQLLQNSEILVLSQNHISRHQPLRFHEFQCLFNTLYRQSETISEQITKLNDHVAHLHELNYRLQEMRTASEEAQLSALKAQMNPHLLFNTLNSILCMIDIDKQGSQKMISDLASLYRHILSSTKKASSDLETEAKIAALYLEIERVRFSDRLTYKIAIPLNAQDIALPCLVLQTLAENAVKHGVAKAAEGGHIEIVATCLSADACHITVTNSGAPLASHIFSNEGTGVANTQRRLDLMFGEAHGFVLHTVDNKTVAEFTIIRQGKLHHEA